MQVHLLLDDDDHQDLLTISCATSPWHVEPAAHDCCHLVALIVLVIFLSEELEQLWKNKATRSEALLLTAQDAVTHLRHVKLQTRRGTGRPGSHEEP